MLSEIISSVLLLSYLCPWGALRFSLFGFQQDRRSGVQWSREIDGLRGGVRPDRFGPRALRLWRRWAIYQHGHTATVDVFSTVETVHHHHNSSDDDIVIHDAVLGHRSAFETGVTTGCSTRPRLTPYAVAPIQGWIDLIRVPRARGKLSVLPLFSFDTL